jgi:hypothetical protein
MIRGSLPALVTPFKNGELDLVALKKLVDWHIAEGSHGLVPVGTTGESPTLSHAEHQRVIEEVVAAAAGRVPVIARGGVEQHGRRDQPDPPRREGGGHGGAGRHTLLQQAHASRADRALYRAA